MNNDRELIYNFNEHGLYYEDMISLNSHVEKVISLAISTIELDFDYLNGKLLTVTGFLPLVKAKKKVVDIPSCVDGSFFVSMDEILYKKGIAYDYFDFFPVSKEYLMIDEYNPKLYYDESNKIIIVGSFDENEHHIRISKNIICGVDQNGTLKSLLIMIDKIKYVGD